MRLISVLPNDNATSNTMHYQGFPPILTEGIDERQQLGGASFLIIEETPDGIFLFRYDAQGKAVGDTWHMNVDDAKHQASYEYGNSLHGWISVPPEVKDIVAFGLSQVRAK